MYFTKKHHKVEIKYNPSTFNKSIKFTIKVVQNDYPSKDQINSTH